MYTFDVTKLDVTFEISNEDYTAIEQRDRDRDDAASERGDEYDYNKIFLSGILDNIEGVADSDYNGHFGPYVFLSINADSDSPEKREEIKTLILDYINGREI